MSQVRHTTAPEDACIVCKFGGTSVASKQKWRRIEEIIRGHLAQKKRVVIVCSAIRGVTDRLEEIVAAQNAGEDPAPALAAVRDSYLALARDLGLSPEPLLGGLLSHLDATVAACPRPVPPRERAAILAHGELLLTRLGAAWLRRRGLDAVWLDARTLLRAEPSDAEDEADAYLSARCSTRRHAQPEALQDVAGASVVVTQGFIASGPTGDTVLLGRGGSDVSAAYVAAAVGAREVEIWTDVPGMFTADPRVVPEARLIRRLSYDEAATLGALGAKVLHPRTLEPARSAGLSLRIGWTDHPELEGTKIDGAKSPRGPKAISTRRDLMLVTMRRPASWQPVGFMAAAARCFARQRLSMDLIASCPAEIRATIDVAAFPSARAALPRLLDELGRVCEPRVLDSVACVSVAGTGLGLDLLSALGAGPHPADAHLVSHAADGSHISLVVDRSYADPLVTHAHRALLAGPLDEEVFGPAWMALQARADDEDLSASSAAPLPFGAPPSSLDPTSHGGAPC